jgi:hypothetical protein
LLTHCGMRLIHCGMKLIPFCWCAMQKEIDFPYADPTWSVISWSWVKTKWHQCSLLYLGKDGGATKFWDDLQKTGCCGTLGYEDWEKVFPNSVPDSCCKVTSVPGCGYWLSTEAVSRIRNYMDPHPFGSRIRIRIHIRVESRIRNRIRIKVEIQMLCVERLKMDTCRAAVDHNGGVYAHN